MDKCTLRNLPTNIKGKKVFLRLDLDVPIENGIIEDDSRLISGLASLDYLLAKGATVIIAGHLGRPEKAEIKYSLEHVAKWFAEKLKIENLKLKNEKVGDFEGWKITDHLYILENLRFYKGEEDNDTEFAKKLASVADIYVNDSFAVCHRTHASIVGITSFLPSYAGLQLEKEIHTLSAILDHPKRPLVMIMGGAKLETKLPLIEKMHHFADYVLVGGKIAQETGELLSLQHEKMPEKKSILIIAQLNEQKSDITAVSAGNFAQIIQAAQTVVWNGPMGKIEEEANQSGTKEIAQAIIQSKAYSVVGGGDTIGFLKTIELYDKFSFVSTGGGAMLSFLAGEKLPGIEALSHSSS